MKLTHLASTAAFAAVAAFSSTPVAQSQSSADDERARLHFGAGRSHFEEVNYEAALQESCLVFGGTNETGIGGVFSDVHRLVPTTATMAPWEHGPVAGDATPPRAFHLAWYDEPRSRLIVYGGIERDNDVLGDLWEQIVVP